jgi:putative glutathione S-transferase
MGLLVDGQWKQTGYESEKHAGEFVRWQSRFRERVTADGSSGFPAAAGRYHLFVSYACPWAHRTILFRKLKGLERAIGLTAVNAFMGDDGWFFDEAEPITGAGARYLREVYARAEPHYTGRVTTPVLWDRERGTIVNNESSEIIRMLDREFDAFAERPELRLCPDALREEIDAMNAIVYRDVNNGVYRAGFATAQEKYDEAVTALFARLDDLEARLGEQRWLVGGQLTEADIRLFVTLVRFDAAYHGHFKCNLRRLVDYPNLWAYARAIYQLPGVAETVRFDAIKEHYYRSHPFINPTRIVPKGPIVDWNAPNGRGLS